MDPNGIDRLFGAGSIFRMYALSAIFVSALLAVFITASLSGGTGAMQTLQATYFGYHAFAMISCLTAATILALVIMVILRYSRIFAIRLDIRGASIRTAEATGYGTAVGFVTAALLPVTLRMVPAQADKMSLAFTPRLLVDAPAAGAVIGYGVGLILAVVTVGRPAENLVYRRLAAPALTIGCLYWLSTVGISPHSILRHLIDPIPNVTMEQCSDQYVAVKLEDSAWLLKAIQDCSGSRDILMGNPEFLWMTSIVIGLIAIVTLFIDFRQGNDSPSEPDEPREHVDSSEPGHWDRNVSL